MSFYNCFKVAAEVTMLDLRLISVWWST